MTLRPNWDVFPRWLAADVKPPSFAGLAGSKNRTHAALWEQAHESSGGQVCGEEAWVFEACGTG
jgi:hypothetical protein